MRQMVTWGCVCWLSVGAVSAERGGPVCKLFGVLPGLYQYRTGQSGKAAAYGVGSGVAFSAAAAMGVLSVYYGNQAEDWRGDF